MEIIPLSQRLKLLEFMGRLKYQLAEWLIVEVKLTDPALSSNAIAELLHSLFSNYDGLVMACTNTDVLMLIQWGKNNSPQKLAKEVRNKLPATGCEATIVPPTKEGLQKLALTIAPPDVKDGPLYMARIMRRDNVFLVADDDMYIRSLIKAGLKGTGSVAEVGDGNAVVDSYKTHNPDMVLLDIHLPGLSGQEILSQLRALDPKAYVIIISADSSPENVKWAKQHGAKGFLTKPFNKERLQEYLEACPTLT
ncbi:MAG: response regulator [Alphaproteobacteria bacterium]